MPVAAFIENATIDPVFYSVSSFIHLKVVSTMEVWNKLTIEISQARKQESNGTFSLSPMDNLKPYKSILAFPLNLESPCTKLIFFVIPRN